MELLVIRHAIAEDRVEFAATGAPDDLRPLTDAGRSKLRRALRGLRTQVPKLDVLATSPLTRTTQTAEIIAERYALVPEPLDALVPDAAPDALVPWLQGQAADATIAVVGHEPHLGSLVGWLIAERNVSVLTFRKGGACLLRFEPDAPPAAGSARLRWVLTPRQLRLLGKRRG